MLAIGEKAPDFNGLDQDGNLRSLDQLLSQDRLVLYFYPRDFTRVCTAQVCLFRDFAAELSALSANIAGVSTDASDTHKKFATQYKVSFPLLADPDGEISRAYDANRWLLNVTKRITYVIDRNRTILGAFHHEFSADKHLEDVKRTLSTSGR